MRMFRPEITFPVLNRIATFKEWLFKEEKRSIISLAIQGLCFHGFVRDFDKLVSIDGIWK